MLERTYNCIIHQLLNFGGVEFSPSLEEEIKNRSQFLADNTPIGSTLLSNGLLAKDILHIMDCYIDGSGRLIVNCGQVKNGGMLLYWNEDKLYFKLIDTPKDLLIIR